MYQNRFNRCISTCKTERLETKRVTLRLPGAHCLPRSHDVARVLEGPAHQLAEHRHEALPPFGEGILDPGRYLGIDPAGEHAILLERPQRDGEHALRDVAQRTLYVVEAHGAVLVQGLEHQHRPLAAQPAQNIAHGADPVMKKSFHLI